MLKAYLIFALRTLSRQRAFALINILGLCIGLTVFTLISLYVHFEFSYDRFHENADRIYRINTTVSLEGEMINHESSSYAGIVHALRRDYPEVESTTVISPFDSEGTFIRFTDKQGSRVALENYKGCYADQSFFDVFSFPLTSGDFARVLQNPYSAVISKSVAEKYFQSNPIGHVLEFTDDANEPKHLIITGVMENVPFNSHLKFDVLINIPDAEANFWDWSGHPYVLLKTDADPHAIESKLDALALSKNGLKTNADDYGQVSTFGLQHLIDIHLFSSLDSEFEPGGNSTLVYSLLTLAIIVVIIAWVNYINLSTALSTEKVKQIGVRKVIGATRKELTLQVLAESALYNALSFILAAAAAWLLLPAFSQLVGVQPGALNLSSPGPGWMLFAFFLFSTLVSGSYPALVISSRHPLSALKGQTGKTEAWSLRKSLVVFQFATATALMIVALVSYHQLTFMQSQKLGIDIDQVLAVKALNFNQEQWSDDEGGYVIDSIWQRKSESFQQELRQLTTIVNTTSLSHLPGQMPNWGTEFKAESVADAKAHTLTAMGIDYNFVRTFQVQLFAGRNFSRDFPSDQGNENKRAILINEAACRSLGFATPESAISKHIKSYWGADYEIIGVINSFHQVSLKENLVPMYFTLQPRALAYFAVNFKAGNSSDILPQIRDIWQRHFPDVPFEFMFLDDFFNSQYHMEAKFTTAMNSITVLALFIGCMGLFGLTSYAIVKRTKEVGIRKVMGASIANIVALFTGDFLRLNLLAAILVVPLAYIGIRYWLQNYPTRVPLEWWMFAGPTGAIAAIAVFTIAVQSLGVAKTNPVESLRGE